MPRKKEIEAIIAELRAELRKEYDKEIQALKAQIAILEQENTILKKQKAGAIPQEIIDQAIMRMEQALNTKVERYLVENTRIALKTRDNIYSVGSLNTIQKRIYLRQKLTREDIELLHKLSRQD